MQKGLNYEVAPNREQIPDGYTHRDVVGVAVDFRDRVYLITRADAHVFVYERDGRFVTAWGEDVFTPQTHGIAAGPDDSIFTVDDGGHAVRKFTPEGKQLMALGNSGVPSDTGYDAKQGVASIKKAALLLTGPPILPWGLMATCIFAMVTAMPAFIAFPPGRTSSVPGEPGTGSGQFNVPHDIAVAPDGRLLVADRENDRIQIFSPEGEYLDQ